MRDASRRADASRAREAAAGRTPGLEALNPALSQAAADRPRADARPGRASSASSSSRPTSSQRVASRPEHLDPLVGNALATLGRAGRARARRSRARSRQLPPTLRQTNTTLVNLRATLGDLRPPCATRSPVAPLLPTRSTSCGRSRATRARSSPTCARSIDRAGTQADLLGVLSGSSALSRAGRARVRLDRRRRSRTRCPSCASCGPTRPTWSAAC